MRERKAKRKRRRNRGLHSSEGGEENLADTKRVSCVKIERRLGQPDSMSWTAR